MGLIRLNTLILFESKLYIKHARNEFLWEDFADRRFLNLCQFLIWNTSI